MRTGVQRYNPQVRAASSKPAQSTMVSPTNLTRYNVAEKTIKKASSYFEKQCDELIEKMYKLCQTVQARGYKNIVESCEVMRRFKMMREVKEHIDEVWDKIKSNMVSFLTADEELIKQFSSIKVSIMEAEKRVEGCRNDEQLAQTKRVLESAGKVKLTSATPTLCRSQEQLLNIKSKQLDELSKQIENYEQILKDYAIKLVQVVTQDDIHEQNGLQQTSQRQARNTREYLQLKQELNSGLKLEKPQSNKQIEPNEILKDTSNQSKPHAITRKRSRKIIQQILDLYQKQQI